MMKKEENKGNLVIAVILVLAVVLLVSIAYPVITGNAPKVKPPVEPDQCQDHLDNDGDGYCDFAWRKAYCIDGSTPGDPACISKDDNDESGDCTPSCYTNTDCGVSGYIGAPYCGTDGNVYKDYRSYTCENAGKCNAVCNEQISAYIWDNCADGCSNGECIVAPEDTCTDSDGWNMLIQGFVSGLSGGEQYNYADSCVNNLTVREYYCSGTTPQSYDWDCSMNQTGCMSGACY